MSDPGPADRPIGAGIPRRPARFAFIDGMRGVAAVAVAVWHLSGAGLPPEPDDSLPGWARTGIAAGANIGVVVFFVISGFVMAYSLRDARPTVGFMARFLARRVVRLAPPYWATIAVAVLTPLVVSAVTGSPARRYPTGQVVSNLFYVQRAFGYDHVQPVFWTLCLEVQFYLAFATLVVIALRWGGGWMVACFAVSLAAPAGLFGPQLQPSHPNGLFFDCFVGSFYMFLLGSLVWAGQDGQVRRSVAPVAAAATVAVGAAVGDVRCIAAGVFAGVILLAATLGRMDRWLSGPIVQYLGRISYSLYLIHPDAGQLAGRLVQRVFGASAVHSLPGFLVEYAAAIATAHVLYRAVERPGIRLSRLLKG